MPNLKNIYIFLLRREDKKTKTFQPRQIFIFNGISWSQVEQEVFFPKNFPKSTQEILTTNQIKGKQDNWSFKIKPKYFNSKLYYNIYNLFFSVY